MAKLFPQDRVVAASQKTFTSKAVAQDHQKSLQQRTVGFGNESHGDESYSLALRDNDFDIDALPHCSASRCQAHALCTNGKGSGAKKQSVLALHMGRKGKGHE